MKLTPILVSAFTLALAASASAPIPSRDKALVVAVAMGRKKLPGIRATLSRGLANGVITDEITAEGLLAAI